jgi:hypothetical protein
MICSLRITRKFCFVKSRLEAFSRNNTFRFSYTAFHIKLPFLKLDIQRVLKADFGISHHSMDNQQKKEHLMKSRIGFSLRANNAVDDEAYLFWPFEVIMN